MFSAEARIRLTQNVAGFENNDDELRKAVAEASYPDERYLLDILT